MLFFSSIIIKIKKPLLTKICYVKMFLEFYSKYLTWIGFIIAICAGDKEGAKFHLNQALVILLANVAGIILQFIPVVGWILGSLWNVFVLVCWILGLIAAINQEEKEVPLLGKIKILK